MLELLFGDFVFGVTLFRNLKRGLFFTYFPPRFTVYIISITDVKKVRDGSGDYNNLGFLESLLLDAPDFGIGAIHGGISGLFPSSI